MRHEYLDQVSLEVARRVAARLPLEPELIQLARTNLHRWMERNAHAPGLMSNYQEWLRILDLPVAEVCSVLTSATEDGQRLRQNSPFVGALSDDEVRQIKAAIRDDQRAA